VVVSKTKISALSLFRLKVLSISLSLLIGFFLVGCGSENIDEENEYKVEGVKISFFDADLDFTSSTIEPIGKVNITDIAKKLGISNAVYAASGKSVILDNYDLTENVNFYAVQDVKEIATRGDLDSVRSGLNGKYILVKDIELNDVAWSPIGQFTGIFNGNFHKITGLWTDTTSNQIGFFSTISDAKIKNLGIEIAKGKQLKGGQYVGGIAGRMSGSSSIVNSYVAGDLTGSNAAGGIVGEIANTASIKNSYSAGSIKGTERVGGIVGHLTNTASVKYTYSTADVTGSSNYVGGIVGGTDNGGKASLENSYSKGAVSGSSSVGGVVGWGNGIIKNNAAINPSIKGTGSNINRVVGQNPNVVSGNIARSGLNSGSSINFGDNNIYSGVGKEDGAFFLEETYKDLGWEFGESDAKPWKIDENSSLPYFYWEDL
jgi:hypothetical protein